MSRTDPADSKAPPDVTGVTAAVSRGYDFHGAISGRFLGHGFNDHFRVTTGGGEYHVRLYLDGKYYIGGDADLEFELGAVELLAGAGCPVARPVRNRAGAFLTLATIGGHTRRMAVFELAPGEPNRSLRPDQAEALGAAVAEIHGRADEVVTTRSRYHLDERYLLDEPLRHLRALAGDGPVDPIARRAEHLRTVLAGLSRESPAYGLIHGDLHLGNLHFETGGRFTIFDFDHCGFGWRAYDLAPLRMSLSDEGWSALLAGYRSRSPLPAGTDLIGEFVAMRVLWDVGDLLAMQAVWGTHDVGDGILAELPQLVARLGLA